MSACHHTRHECSTSAGCSLRNPAVVCCASADDARAHARLMIVHRAHEFSASAVTHVRKTTLLGTLIHLNTCGIVYPKHEHVSSFEHYICWVIRVSMIISTTRQKPHPSSKPRRAQNDDRVRESLSALQMMLSRFDCQRPLSLLWVYRRARAQTRISTLGQYVQIKCCMLFVFIRRICTNRHTHAGKMA